MLLADVLVNHGLSDARIVPQSRFTGSNALLILQAEERETLATHEKSRLPVLSQFAFVVCSLIWINYRPNSEYLI